MGKLILISDYTDKYKKAYAIQTYFMLGSPPVGHFPSAYETERLKDPGYARRKHNEKVAKTVRRKT